MRTGSLQYFSRAPVLAIVLCGATLGLVAGCRGDDQAAPGPTVPAETATSRQSECVDAKGCAYATLGWVSSETDCACPVCPSEAVAITRKELDDRKKKWVKVCGTWAKTHACAPSLCQRAASLTCAEGGTCGLAK